MDREAWNNLYVGDAPDSGTGTEEMFLGVAQELKPGKALDLGCGSGVLSLALAERGWTVTGVDFADTAISLAQAAAADRGLEVAFVVADVVEWKPAEPFDLVVSAFATPPRGTQRDAAFATARRSVAPGGTLIVAEWHRSMAETWSFMTRDDLVSLQEVVAGLKGLTIDRGEVQDVAVYGERARSVFVQAHRPI